MKKAVLHLLTFLLVSGTCLATPLSMLVSVDGGILKDKNGSLIPDGSLVLLLASPTGAGFTADVNAGSYVGGDAVVVGSFGLTNVYGPGEAVTTWDCTIESGYKLALRWFPNVTETDYQNVLFSPAAGLYFGTYAGTTTGNPDGGDPWVANSQGSLQLNFWTTDIPGGTQDPSKGQATSQIQAVPEPSSVALLAAGSLLVGAMLRRRKVA